MGCNKKMVKNVKIMLTLFMETDIIKSAGKSFY